MSTSSNRQFDQIARMGLPNYVQLNSTPAGEGQKEVG